MSPLVLLVVKIKKNREEKYMYQIKKKCYEEKLVDLLLMGEVGKSDYVFIKGFNTFMYDHT